MGNLNNKYN